MTRQQIGLLSGPLIFILLIVLPTPDGLSQTGMYVAATAVLMAIWWTTEAIPLSATALVPIVVFPFLGVSDAQQVTLAYANHYVYLFMGGFLIAVTIEKWDLHKRIALHTIRLTGTTPKRIMLGFMLATAFLSMWISNTATAMLMVTIGMAIIKQLQQTMNIQDSSFGMVLMLSIAYSASIGGVATLIGTPPNAILAGIAESHFDIQIGFIDWMQFAFPLSAIMLFLTWVYLTRFIRHHKHIESMDSKKFIANELEKLGEMNPQQKQVLLVFTGVALLWILRGFLPSEYLQQVNDSTIAILGGLILFLIPVKLKERTFLLDWQTAKTIPWDILILFGGGFALANGFSSSGLTDWIAIQLSGLQGSHILLVIALLTLTVIFLTEITSNTATASLLIPVVGAMAIAMNVHPLISMTAVAIASSYAFMLPVATPPNAIVFASRTVSIPQMVRTGFFLNLLSSILISLFIIFVLPVTFGIEIEQIIQKLER